MSFKESFNESINAFYNAFFNASFNECECKEFKECKECKNVITRLTNRIVFIITFICICIISRNNRIKGFITFYFFLFIFAYFIHYFAHKYKCLFSISHHYHHYIDNTFSHFFQLSGELTNIMYLYPIYYFTNTTYFDAWALFYYLVIYSSIHNINYGYFHVNNFHELHHENPLTNLGPDLCDIFFGTKNKFDPDAENISHYIPNIIICAIVVLFLQFICLNKTYEKYLKNAFIYGELFLSLICFILSVYIYYHYPEVLK